MQIKLRTVGAVRAVNVWTGTAFEFYTQDAIKVQTFSFRALTQMFSSYRHFYTQHRFRDSDTNEKLSDEHLMGR